MVAKFEDNARLFNADGTMKRPEVATPAGWNAKTDNDEVAALYAIAAKVVGAVSPTTTIQQASRFVGGVVVVLTQRGDVNPAAGAGSLQSVCTAISNAMMQRHPDAVVSLMDVRRVGDPSNPPSTHIYHCFLSISKPSQRSGLVGTGSPYARGTDDN
jgi:hypothetical protein